MIRHFVLLRFKKNMAIGLKDEIFKALEKLQGHLNGIIDFKAVENISIECDLIHGFDYGFWFDFEDARARDEYLDDDFHRQIGEIIIDNTEGGRDGIVVFDMKM